MRTLTSSVVLQNKKQAGAELDQAQFSYQLVTGVGWNLAHFLDYVLTCCLLTFYLLTCSPPYLLTCAIMLTCMRAACCFLACWLTCLLAFLLTCSHSYLLTGVLVIMIACMLAACCFLASLFACLLTFLNDSWLHTACVFAYLITCYFIFFAFLIACLPLFHQITVGRQQ